MIIYYYNIIYNNMHYYIWYSSHCKRVWHQLKLVRKTMEPCLGSADEEGTASPALRQHIKHQYLLFGNLKFHTHPYCVRKGDQRLKRVTGSQRSWETRMMKGWSSSDFSIHLYCSFFLSVFHSIMFQLILDVISVSWITAGHRAKGGWLSAVENRGHEHKSLKFFS